MKTKTVICKSGIRGWQGKLRDQYDSFEEFESWCQTYNLHIRLGYKTPRGAWMSNPVIQGSVNPDDYIMKVKVTKKA